MSLPLVELQEIAEVKLGRQRSPSNHQGDSMRPYVRAANIGWGGWKLEDVKEMNFTEKEMTTYRLQPGDVLVGEASGSAKEVGKPAIWAGEIEECAFQNTLIRVRPGTEVLPRYLLHFFKHQAATGRFARGSRGVGIFHLGRKALAAWPIPLPGIEEQRRIAAVLDAADDLRTKRRQALAKLDTLTQAIFIDMFDGDWNRWPFVPVEELAEQRKGAMRTGPFGSQLLHEEFVDSGIAVLGIDNAVHNEFAWGQRRYITPEKYEELKRFTVVPGDVLVTIMGTCGRVAVVPEDVPTAINTKHLCCVTLDKTRTLPEWMWASLLFHPRVLDQLGATFGAVMPGLNMGKIKQAEIPLPSLAVQRGFVDAKKTIFEKQPCVASSLASFDTLFASLQQRAFAGEL